jgi:phosphodiesterase/alkaline phosphatase D-like protein
MRRWWWAWVCTAIGVLLAQALGAQVQITGGPVIELADSNSATISWVTSQPSNSRVWYGEDADELTEIAEGSEGATAHRVRIEGLQPNTTYFFQVETGQGSASTTTENPAIMSFRTVAVGQQSVRNQKATIAQKNPL